MADPEALLARRIGFRVGMWDWWNLKRLHTPFEWQLQMIAESIEPMGEERADMRAAVHTTRLVAAVTPGGQSEAEQDAEVENLRYYLAVNQPEDRVLSPEEAAELKRME